MNPLTLLIIGGAVLLAYLPWPIWLLVMAIVLPIALSWSEWR